MFKGYSRGLRSVCFAVACAAATLASGMQLSVPPFAPAARIGSLAVGLASAQTPSFEEGMKRATAGLGRSDAVTVENLVFDLGFMSYRIPRIEVVGTTLSAAELAAALAPAPGESAASRLGRLSAREARIPELRIEQSWAGFRGVAVYRDIVARDIVNGRIGSLTSPGATLEASIEKAGAVKAASGRVVIDGLDLAHTVAVFGNTAEPQHAEMKTLYGAFAMDDFTMTGPEGANVRLARMTGSGVKARPIAQAWNTYMAILSQQPDLEKLPPADRARLFNAMADLYEGIEAGSMEATGLEIRNPSAKEQGVGRIARIAFAGETASRPGDMRAEGFDFVSGKGKARIATIALTGFSYRDSLQGLRNLGEKPLDKLDPADLRRLIPTLGTIRVSGVDFDVPNEKAKTPGAENIRFGIRDMEITADKPINGIPSNLRFAVDNFTFAIPADAKEDGLRELAAMGYRLLDVSFGTAASWSEPGSEVVLREVSVRGADMGSAVLRGVIGNVGKDVFNVDPAVAMVALIGATARNVELRIENNGLFERLLGEQAKKQNKSADDLRREYGMAAAIVIPQLLGNSSAAKTLGQAVARFVAKPGRLTISARAKNGGGLGISDFIGASEPAAVLDKLEVNATVE
jgi:hypothetical protein